MPPLFRYFFYPILADAASMSRPDMPDGYILSQLPDVMIVVLIRLTFGVTNGQISGEDADRQMKEELSYITDVMDITSLYNDCINMMKYLSVLIEGFHSEGFKVDPLVYTEGTLIYGEII